MSKKSVPHSREARQPLYSPYQLSVINIAVHNFKCFGFSQFSLDKIAAHGNLELSRLEREFGSKEQLLEACVQYAIKVAQKRLLPVLLEAQSVRQKHISESLLEYFANHADGCWLFLHAAELKRISPSMAELLAVFFATWASMISILLKSAYARGVSTEWVDRVLKLLIGSVVLSHVLDDEIYLHKACDQLDTLCSGRN